MGTPQRRGSVRTRDALSTDSESQSPANKRATIKDITLQDAPPDDAPFGVWCKFLLKSFVTLNDNFRSLSNSNNFACDQAQDALDQMAGVQKSVKQMELKFNNMSLK